MEGKNFLLEEIHVLVMLGLHINDLFDNKMAILMLFDVTTMTACSNTIKRS